MSAGPRSHPARPRRPHPCRPRRPPPGAAHLRETRADLTRESGRAGSQGGERAAGAARPLYSAGGRGSRCRNRAEWKGAARGRRASACTTRPDSPAPARWEGPFGPSLPSGAARVWWSRRAGWPRRSPDSPREPAWPTHRALVPAASRGGLGWPRGPGALAGAQVGLAGKPWPPSARGPAMMLPGASVPGPGCANWGPIVKGLGSISAKSFFIL